MGKAAAAVSPTGRAVMAAGAGAGKAADMVTTMRDIVSGKGLPGMTFDWKGLGKKINDSTTKAVDALHELDRKMRTGVLPMVDIPKNIPVLPREVLPSRENSKGWQKNFLGIGRRRT